jgi:hypothetical protein
VAPGVLPSGMRGAVATRDIPARGIIAAVPVRLTIRFPLPKSHDDLMVGAHGMPCCKPRWIPQGLGWTPRVSGWLMLHCAAPPAFNLWRAAALLSATPLPSQAVAEWMALEARNATSPYAPYLHFMPSLWDANHTLSYETFPLAYLHLLQDGGPLVSRRAAPAKLQRLRQCGGAFVPGARGFGRKAASDATAPEGQPIPPAIIQRPESKPQPSAQPAARKSQLTTRQRMEPKPTPP